MRRCAALLLCALLCQFAVAQSNPTKRSITDKDLFKFQWVGDPQVSPDGQRVVFVRVTVNEKKDGYDTALWVVKPPAESHSLRSWQCCLWLVARHGRSRICRARPRTLCGRQVESRLHSFA